MWLQCFDARVLPVESICMQIFTFPSASNAYYDTCTVFQQTDKVRENLTQNGSTCFFVIVCVCVSDRVAQWKETEDGEKTLCVFALIFIYPF